MGWFTVPQKLFVWAWITLLVVPIFLAQWLQCIYGATHSIYEHTISLCFFKNLGISYYTQASRLPHKIQEAFLHLPSPHTTQGKNTFKSSLRSHSSCFMFTNLTSPPPQIFYGGALTFNLDQAIGELNP